MNTKISPPTFQAPPRPKSPSPSSSKFKSYLEGKKRGEEDEEPRQNLSPMLLMSERQGAGSCSIESSTPISCSASLQSLFHEIVGEIEVLIDKGDRETTIYVNETNHLFSGLEISIKEFCSAPKIFNIELKGAPETVALLDQHLSELSALFHSTPMSFSVHRIEAKLSERTKEASKRGQEDAKRRVTQKSDVMAR